jgi:hypothetical protein
MNIDDGVKTFLGYFSKGYADPNCIISSSLPRMCANGFPGELPGRVMDPLLI